MAPLVDVAPLTFLARCGNKSRKCYRKKFTEHSLTFCAYMYETQTGSLVNLVTILRVGSIVNCVVNIGTSNIRGILILLAFSSDLIDSFYHRANTCDNYFMRKILECSCGISFIIANHFFLEERKLLFTFCFILRRISSIFFYNVFRP